MEIKIKKLLEGFKDKKVGVFCDDSNLYHSYQKYGWRIDFGRFKKLLEDYCDLQFINYAYKENMAWELRLCWHIYLNRIKDEIALQ